MNHAIKMSVAVAAVSIVMAAWVADAAPPRSYEPGEWAGFKWTPAAPAIPLMEKGKTPAMVFFYNPKDRAACRAWEVQVFDKIKDEVKEDVEGKVLFVKVNSQLRDDLPDDKELKKEWKEWCGPVNAPKTYVRVITSDCKKSLFIYEKPPTTPDAFLKDLKKAIEKNEKHVQAAEKKTEAGKGKKTTEKGADGQTGDDAAKSAGKEAKTEAE